MADPTEQHAANRRYWDAQATQWRQLREQDGLWRRCAANPELAFEGGALALIRRYCGELRGRPVCVVGSGDNYAAFALAGLGARVTSTDISQGQLDVAAARARELGLAITFVRADAADLGPLPDRAFDLVCSTNGFFVWIAAPARVFAAIARVLRPGGFYIFYDVHPFQRPWQDQVQPPAMAKPYWDTGPYVDEDGAAEHNWTMADLVNPLVKAGLEIREMLERPAADSRFWEGHGYAPGAHRELLDWRTNPRAGLPVWLAVCARRPGEDSSWTNGQISRSANRQMTAR